MVVESLAVAMWGELRSFCETDLQVKTVESMRPFSHAVKWFFHVSAQSTATKWHATLHVRSYTNHCTRSALHVHAHVPRACTCFESTYQARAFDRDEHQWAPSANSSRSTDQHFVAQSSMPWYVQELHHRQLELLAAIEQYEQRTVDSLKDGAHTLAQCPDGAPPSSPSSAPARLWRGRRDRLEADGAGGEHECAL